MGDSGGSGMFIDSHHHFPVEQLFSIEDIIYLLVLQEPVGMNSGAGKVKFLTDQRRHRRNPVTDLFGVILGDLRDHCRIHSIQGNIFKTSFESTIDTDVDGGFIEKDGNNYYDRGEWEIDSDTPSDTRGALFITNPISESFISETWGACQGKVSVTVPIGTFQAWKFYKKLNHNETVFTEVSLWFVPYIGYVKLSETDWEGETKVWNSESELTSYSFK